MATQRMIRSTFIPLTALTLLAALLFLTISRPSPAIASGVPEPQQAQGNMPMTHTMPMTETQPTMTEHQMHQGMMNHEQAGMGDQMISMGRRMQMMGMMMQMMGHMHKMHEHMQGMMGGDMPMMQGMMGGNMPMTHTMPMTDGMGMGHGMGMMDGMMAMPMMDQMMDMGAMHGMMGQMMDSMMAEMHEMHQMHGMMGMDHSAMNHDTAKQAPTDHSTMDHGAINHRAAPADLTQTAQVGAIEIVATALNLTDTEAETIDFELAFNSHSVTIDIDLVNSALLQVDDVEVTPAVWETATPAGHHIKGLLRFPRNTEDGATLLTDTTAVTLLIGGLPDDEERTFTWVIQ